MSLSPAISIQIYKGWKLQEAEMCFTKNESTIDRILRVIAGVVFLVLGFGGFVGGGLGLFFKIFGFIPLLTGVIGFCPIYALLGMRTNKG